MCLFALFSYPSPCVIMSICPSVETKSEVKTNLTSFPPAGISTELDYESRKAGLSLALESETNRITDIEKTIKELTYERLRARDEKLAVLASLEELEVSQVRDKILQELKENGGNPILGEALLNPLFGNGRIILQFQPSNYGDEPQVKELSCDLDPDPRRHWMSISNMSLPLLEELKQGGFVNDKSKLSPGGLNAWNKKHYYDVVCQSISRVDKIRLIGLLMTRYPRFHFRYESFNYLDQFAPALDLMEAYTKQNQCQFTDYSRHARPFHRECLKGVTSIQFDNGGLDGVEWEFFNSAEDGTCSFKVVGRMSEYKDFVENKMGEFIRGCLIKTDVDGKYLIVGDKIGGAKLNKLLTGVVSWVCSHYRLNISRAAVQQYGQAHFNKVIRLTQQAISTPNFHVNVE